MKRIVGGYYTGERALYDLHDAYLENVSFGDGESPLKECSNLELEGCTFSYKYPLWYGAHFKLNNCKFELMSRSGIWYTDDIEIKNSEIICPKLFRRAANIVLENVRFEDAQETFWNSKYIKLKNVIVEKGDYMFLNCENIEIDNLKTNGNYAFDGSKNIKVTDSVINSKDSFWNTENVVVENTIINGEYIGWNSKNLTFINCDIESDQGFCYVDGLTLINCRFKNTPLCFERCSKINAEINSFVDSIKNPYDGRIVVDSVGEIILDEKVVDKTKTEIIIKH